nr:FAD-dependent oxidoreductase [Paracoccus mutanolyticus]
MFATGRVPNTAGLGLDELGVALGPRGQVLVDEWSQSSVPSIFAVGDVTDRVNLTPVAIREGHCFADTVFGARPRKVDHSLFGAAVYTRPHEVASIGLTEEEAGGAVRTTSMSQASGPCGRCLPARTRAP